jgi:hypothetical protein
VVDTNGLPVRLGLTAGEAHDNRLADKSRPIGAPRRPSFTDDAGTMPSVHRIVHARPKLLIERMSLLAAVNAPLYRETNR